MPFLDVVGELLAFSGCSVFPRKPVLTPHLLKIVYEVKASGLSFVLKLWLVVGRGMFPVKYFNKSCICQLNLMAIIGLSQGEVYLTMLSG